MGCWFSWYAIIKQIQQRNQVLLCAIDLFSKYAWVVPLKDRRRITINAFQKIISKRRKPYKIWVDQGCEFYNKLFKRFLKKNNIEMYSTYNEGKTVVAARSIRTLKSKIFRHSCFKCLFWCVRRYSFINTVHRTIKMEPIMTLHLTLMLNTMKILMKKILKLQLVIMLGFKNTNTFLLKDTLKIGWKLLLLVKLKTQFRGHTLLVI